MKATIIAIVVVGLMAVTLSLRNSDTISYVKEEVIKEVEKVPDWAQDEDAVKAAQAVIRKKELEAELTSLDAQIKELQTKRKSVTDELTTY